MKTQKKNKSKNYFLLLMLLIVTSTISAQNLVSHDFNNGNLGPFEVCTTGSPNYSRVINNRLKTFWAESAYNGTRTYRGAEACGDQFYTYKEGWYGMNLELGSDYPKNKKAGVAQIFGFIPGFWSWEAQLQIDNGDLTIVHRPNGGIGQNTEEVVYANFPYQVKVPIVIHFILSNQNKGLFEIWVGGKIEYRKTNINFGFGDFDNNDVKIGDADADRGAESGGSLTVFKMGQYNFESDDYDNNETRTVYYDDVSWYKGSNGYDIVNPDGGTSQEGNVVQMRKRNSSSYALDGGNNGANGQNVYLWSQNSSNVNQQWVEIDRGGGYYSYQKKGTNYCLDGGNGGGNGQNVYLWTCNSPNQNQHWDKISSGSHFRLQKRNAPGYSIDGGNGGGNGQNLYLWTSSSSNQNQQWMFNNLSTSKNSAQKADQEQLKEELDSFSVYPNPVENELIIRFDNNYDQETSIALYDVNGKKIIESKSSNNDVKMDLSQLRGGIYILTINNKSRSLTKKIVKL